MRGWPNTVEMELFEISNSMKPYPPLCFTRHTAPASFTRSEEGGVLSVCRGKNGCAPIASSMTGEERLAVVVCCK